MNLQAILHETFYVMVSILGMLVGFGLLFWVSWHKTPDQKELGILRMLGLLGGCLLVPMPFILGAWLIQNSGDNLWLSRVFGVSAVLSILYALILIWFIIKWIRGYEKRQFLARMAVLLVIFTGFVVWVVYEMFVEGTTSGPDFISAIQSDNLAAATISSIEVVEPAVGHTPFTAKELDSLARRVEIDSPASINRLVAILMGAQLGREAWNMNHPASIYEAYLKVKTKDGFFWLYCNVEKDGRGAIFDIESNTRNATNPNGASSYHLENYSEVLAILKNGKNTIQDDPVRQ